MTIDTIKGNIDRKIERFLKVEKLSLSEAKKQLFTTKENFKRLSTSDLNSSARLHMMLMYIDFAEKRLKDIEFIENKLSTCYFFAGADENTLFNLIKLRDKVSQDVLESEFN